MISYTPPGWKKLEIVADSNNLLKNARNGDWEVVVNMYKNNPLLRKAQITRSGNTALHIAIWQGQESVVERMIQCMIETSETNAKEAIKIKNEQGNTPLHLAAAFGSVRMCKCIAKIDSSLIGHRNYDSETPFFLAVLHGRKDAFLCLHSFCEGNQGYSFCRRNDGDTILHCAIAGEHFDLAFQIIHLYGNLVNYVNGRGFSPLHILACKPSAFKSASRISGYSKIIYPFIIVGKLERNVNAKCLENFGPRKVFRPLEPGSGQHADAEDPDRQQFQGKQGEIRAPVYCGFRAIYLTCFNAIKFMSKAMLIIFCLASVSIEIVKLQDRKKKHIWSVQVLDELLKRTSSYKYENTGRNPQQPPLVEDDETKPYSFQNNGDVAFCVSGFARPPEEDSGEIGKNTEMEKRETPILTAAKNGAVEMVDKILQYFPVAIHDKTSDKKNVVLLAAENRQPYVYQLLLKMTIIQDSIFQKVDKDGNTALHLAATLGEYQPWLVPGAALQMQSEITWYEFVKNSMPLHFHARFNKKGKTPEELFTETHKDLVKSGVKWLTLTSKSCSIVATLIATVVFATSTTIPGGAKQDSGKPTLENEPAFFCFAISSLIALCCSVTSLVSFLSVLTSEYQEKDFGTSLPGKLLLGLTLLFVSIASMLISFCSGHFFVLKDKLKFGALPVYTLTCLSVTLFAVAQFPSYIDLIWATLGKVPHRSYKGIPM